MAIDTTEKRNSAFLDPWGIPFPGDSANAQQHVFLGLYSDLGVALPAGLGDVVNFRMAFRRSAAFNLER